MLRPLYFTRANAAGKALHERLVLRKFAVWASLISNIVIVFTGAVVRLTGSGLGCPTWPKCTQESLVTVQAQGIHGVIEFTNRMLTFVLVVIAVLTLWVFRKAAGFRALSWALLAGIPAQAVIGGISVWTKLNPWVVGCHFLISVVLIALATILVWRFYSPQLDPASPVSNLLAWFIAAFGLLAILVGVMVTGAGPHAGGRRCCSRSRCCRRSAPRRTERTVPATPPQQRCCLVVLHYRNLGSPECSR